MKICKTCGKFILDDENGDLAFTVNPGLPDKEYVECESCHDHAIDRSKIIQCEACGFPTMCCIAIKMRSAAIRFALVLPVVKTLWTV